MKTDRGHAGCLAPALAEAEREVMLTVTVKRMPVVVTVFTEELLG